MNENYYGNKVVIKTGFGNQLYDFIDRENITVTEMSKQCGVSYSYLNGLLNGSIYSKKATINKVCKKMGISIEDVIESEVI